MEIYAVQLLLLPPPKGKKKKGSEKPQLANAEEEEEEEEEKSSSTDACQKMKIIYKTTAKWRQKAKGKTTIITSSLRHTKY